MTDTETLVESRTEPQHPRTPCGLCYEDISASSMIHLSQCRHSSCQDCFTNWIAMEEASGKSCAPVCPFCRLEISAPDVLEILGRPYQPCSRTAVEVEVDDLTRQWLEEQTRQCAHCGAHIEKLPGGCDKMECLCGYRFCYGCGAQDAQCSCTPSHHYFWDNVLDGLTRAERAQVANEEATGYIELKNHILQRRRQEHQRQVRQERAVARDCRLQEQQDMDFSARWLFCQRVQTSYIVLNQLTQATFVKTQRARLRQRDKRSIEQEDWYCTAQWLFFQDPKRGCRNLDRVLNQQRQKAVIQMMRKARKRFVHGEIRKVYCLGGADAREYVAAMRALFGGWPLEKQIARNIRLSQ